MSLREAEPIISKARIESGHQTLRRHIRAHGRHANKILRKLYMATREDLSAVDGILNNVCIKLTTCLIQPDRLIDVQLCRQPRPRHTVGKQSTREDIANTSQDVNMLMTVRMHRYATKQILKGVKLSAYLDVDLCGKQKEQAEKNTHARARAHTHTHTQTLRLRPAHCV